jgi:hypothetical protein
MKRSLLVVAAFAFLAFLISPTSGQDIAPKKAEPTQAEKDQKAFFAIYPAGIEIEVAMAETPVKVVGRVDGIVEVFGRRFLKLQAAGKTFLVNPDRIGFIVNR